MLRRHSETLKKLFYLSDLLALFSAWAIAYVLRFKSGLWGGDSTVNFAIHVKFFVYLLITYFFAARMFDLYRPMRGVSVWGELKDVSKAVFSSVIGMVLFMYFLHKDYTYSRLSLLIFVLVALFIFLWSRLFLRGMVSFFRKRGYNQRFVLIVGSGPNAIKFKRSLDTHPEYGYNVLGFLSSRKDKIGDKRDGVDVIGHYRDLPRILTEKTVDGVVFALSAGNERYIRPLLGMIDDESVNIKIVPDLGGFFTLRKSVEEFDGLPVLSLRESPLCGWGRALKRLVDIIFSAMALLILSPVFAILAILVKLSSRGPVFYKQKRMGLDGEEFNIYKFRSMIIDAESKTGAVWSVAGDDRRTWIGAFMRETSLDEIPQFYNVLKGDMSLVGPRPERPVFVNEFKKKVPKYMLRHKMKAGITGWAQVKGLRGNTSLEKRIECDLFYIEHWSIWLDIKILFMTPMAVIKGEGAH